MVSIPFCEKHHKMHCQHAKHRYNGSLINHTTDSGNPMLGKLFGFGKKDKPAAAPKPEAIPENIPAKEPKPVKVAAPSILDTLTGGAPLDTITDTDILHQLVKQSDKLDKKTNRQVRERINQLKEQDKELQQNHDKQEKLCVRLETLSRLQHHPLFDSELAHLQQQWQSIELKLPTFDARVQNAIVRCLQLQQEAAKLKQQQEQATKEVEALARQREQDSIEQAARYAAEQAEKKDKQMEEHEKKEKQQQQTQAERQNHERTQKEICQNLAAQISQLDEAINIADQKKARDLHEKARDNLKKLDQKYAHDFDGKLHLLSGRLRELQDWQSFAAMPKLEELCLEMEKMIVTELPVLQKADAVRELQNQWRATRPPSNKQANALWDRFKLASDKAWEPCAAHFEKERLLRAFNLQQRQAICDALEQFHAAQNWQAADWKAVARILEKAKQEFHDFHPVERNDEKTIRARFDAALGAVNLELLTEQKNNEDKKRQLVNAAQSIAEMSDMDKAVERVRQIQDQWKLIGITRRQEDQKLWQQLQDQTTIIFDKRRANQQKIRDTESSQIEQAKSLCGQIAALASLSDAELSQSGAEFDRLQAEYKAIESGVHEKVQQSLKKIFYAACDNYRQQLSGISKRQHASQLQELARRAQLCAQLETAPDDSSIDAIQTQWQQQNLPPEWEQAIEKRRQQALAAAQDGSQPDYEGNEQRLRELCIELEILLDVETPEEDRQHRRNYQLRRLQQGLGQTAGNQPEKLEQLQVQWHCASPASPAVQSGLQARFDAVLKRVRNVRS
jgi:exonuclease SbcC